MYQLITAPTVEPVTLAEVKASLRITDASRDALIAGILIPAARSYAETITRRALCTQTWELIADQFPGPSLIGVPYGKTYTLPGHALLLDKCPVQSIASIKYTAMDGSTQTMSATDYAAELSSEPSRITPAFGRIWPIPLPQIGSVRVRFVAGYGGADQVPAPLKAWIMAAVGSMNENPEVMAIVQRGQEAAEFQFINGLLDGFRVPVV